jgi:selenocysteine lyase/cysteine desulfurase
MPRPDRDGDLRRCPRQDRPGNGGGGVKLTLSANRFRLTPSVQNDDADIDRFLAALPRA